MENNLQKRTSEKEMIVEFYHGLNRRSIEVIL